jgi:outer membrane receptor for ferrienterochelin and colicin
VQHAFDLVPLTVKLSPVVVEGAQTRSRLADFERRRAGKVGYFLTREDIEKLNASTLSDILARARGVTLDCVGGVCNPRMARSQPSCDPQYYVDGNESSMYFARATPPHDIIGIEVYRGPSELPAEFSGSKSGCGVIVIWTKSSP